MVTQPLQPTGVSIGLFTITTGKAVKGTEFLGTKNQGKPTRMSIQPTKIPVNTAHSLSGVCIRHETGLGVRGKTGLELLPLGCIGAAWWLYAPCKSVPIPHYGAGVSVEEPDQEQTNA